MMSKGVVRGVMAVAMLLTGSEASAQQQRGYASSEPKKAKKATSNADRGYRAEEKKKTTKQSNSR